jgi:hypothetical protein
VSTWRCLDGRLPAVTIGAVPEGWVRRRHIRTIPGKLRKRDQLAIEEHAHRPNPPVIAGPSRDLERWRCSCTLARLLYHAERGLILATQSVSAVPLARAPGAPSENPEDRG